MSSDNPRSRYSLERRSNCSLTSGSCRICSSARAKPACSSPTRATSAHSAVRAGRDRRARRNDGQCCSKKVRADRRRSSWPGRGTAAARSAEHARRSAAPVAPHRRRTAANRPARGAEAVNEVPNSSQLTMVSASPRWSAGECRGRVCDPRDRAASNDASCADLSRGAECRQAASAGHGPRRRSEPGATAGGWKRAGKENGDERKGRDTVTMIAEGPGRPRLIEPARRARRPPYAIRARSGRPPIRIRT